MTPTLTAKSGNVVLGMDAPHECVGGVLLPDSAMASRLGTVWSSSADSALSQGQRVIASMYGRTEFEGLTIMPESMVYALEGGLYPLAFAGRLVLMMDVEPEALIAKTEAQKNDEMMEGKAILRTATVLSSGLPEYEEGSRVWVSPECFDALEIIQSDIDVSYDIPDGQMIRVYKPCPREGVDAIYRWVPGLIGERE